MKIPRMILNADLFEQKITAVPNAKAIEAKIKAQEKKALEYPIKIEKLKAEIAKMRDAKTSYSKYSLQQAEKALKRTELNYSKLLNKL